MSEQNATQSLRLTPEMEQIRFDAMRLLDLHNPRPTADDLWVAMSALAHQQFLKNIEPILKAKTDMVLLGTGGYRLHADGRMEHVPQPLTTSQQEATGLFDEMIAREAERFKMPNTYTPDQEKERP